MTRTALPPLLRRLSARIGRGARFGLRGVHQALAVLGAPQRALRAVHVAGTNGKGSVCAMVEAVALAAGLRTGLYTSPHLCRYRERIRIGGRPIDDESFARALGAALDPRLPELTFFETMTVAGFEAMRQAAVDLAIIEVGLGGRLDATNVLEAPLATAICTIDADHEAVLGHDLAAIAAEKAGIAKPGAPLVVGRVSPRCWRTIDRVSRRLGAAPVWRVAAEPLAVDGAWGAAAAGPFLRVSDPPPGAPVVVTGPAGRCVRARLGLAGVHQPQNAAVAMGIVWLLEATWPGLAAHAARGLGAVHWPGRLERLVAGPAVIWLDGAHNPAGAEALARSLRGRCDPARTTLVFGAMEDKAWPAMLDCLAPLANRRLYTEPLRPIAGRRSADPRALARRAPGQWLGDPRFTIERALAQALPGETIVVAGSVFLVGAVRAALLGLEQDEVLPL